MATTQIAASKLATGIMEQVALSRLVASSTNPRKTFDQTGLAELAASITEHGILQPLLVRPFGKGDQLEVVAGERRFRSAHIAKLVNVPVLIALLNDDEAKELQVIENLQRTDIHPLEEAEGYRALHRAPAEIARRVGKDVAYVAQRLQLIKLELLAKELYAASHVDLEHAITLCKLTPADQLRAVKWLMGWNQMPAKTDWLELMARRIKEHQGKDYRLVRETAATLDKWVRDHVLLVLKKAPWNLTDAVLLPEAGACTDCPKRTGSNVALFASLTAEDDICTDAKCFEAKQKAFLKLSLAAAQDKGTTLVKLSNKGSNQPIEKTAKLFKSGQWVKAKKGTCPDVQQGIVIDGPAGWTGTREDTGAKLYICANQSCTVHKHEVQGKEDQGATRAAQLKAQAKQEAVLAVEREVRHELFLAMLPLAKPEHGFLQQMVFAAAERYAAFVVTALELVQFDPIDETDHTARHTRKEAALVFLRQYIDKATDTQLHHVAFIASAADALSISAWQFANNKKVERRPTWEMAQQLGVDADKIALRVETQHKQKTAAAKSAAPKKGKK